MVTTVAPGIRRSLADLQNDYDSGTKGPLEKLMRAWKGIKELPPDDPRSFFMIGGYHGEPFRGKGELDPNWWGGYCQHGTVLFPTWHRIYCWRLEKALQSIPGCEDVMLPFWDECNEDSRNKGIPSALTEATFVLDGKEVPNPLRSFVLPIAIDDRVKGDTVVYSKPAGYETVRYPLSGLVGTPENLAATRSHNAQFPDHARNIVYLNDNITTWLNGKIRIDGVWRGEVLSRFVQSLDAPSYTLFSNTTSASAWQTERGPNVVSLESPHNTMHLAVGGFDYPGQGDDSAIPGANGDMGENDTAGLDPIFFFHHCFIDYVFWIWQRRNLATDAFDIDPKDPGANSNANPPPAGIEPNTPLTLDTPLEPFRKADGSRKFTSRDCVNIETQLGYTYGPGSLDQYAQRTSERRIAATAPGRTVRVSGINRAAIRGSFLIATFATIDGKREHIGTEAVLSRWHVEGCMNCQNHLEAMASFQLPVEPGRSLAAEGGIEVEVRTRHGLLGGRAQSPAAAARPAALAEPFKVEIR
ncbi:MAG: tyrosinase family protein [Stellaceae bacterium]